MTEVPNYILYGEKSREIFPDYLHIESIRSRSIHNSWNFKLHQHVNLHQFFYIKRGGGVVIIGETEFILNDHLFISVPPSTVHGFKFAPDTEGWVITLPQIYLLDIVEKMNLLAKSAAQTLICNCTNEPYLDELIYIFKSINQAYEGRQPTRDFRLKCYANLLVGALAEMQPIGDAVAHKIPKRQQVFVQEFEAQINQNYKKRLSVAEYAALMNITPTHLNRVCKAVLNVSPLGLIDERSVLEAKRLLSYTAMNIAEIAFELGFFDAAHFSKFFIKKTRQKPSGFRKSFDA